MSTEAQPQEAGDYQQEVLVAVPISRISYTLKSGEQTTGMELHRGMFVRGRFQGRVVGLNYAEGASKQSGDIVPEWNQKWIIAAIDVELDGEE